VFLVAHGVQTVPQGLSLYPFSHYFYYSIQLVFLSGQFDILQFLISYFLPVDCTILPFFQATRDSLRVDAFITDLVLISKCKYRSQNYRVVCIDNFDSILVDESFWICT
jgi:hypothetical protein